MLQTQEFSSFSQVYNNLTPFNIIKMPQESTQAAFSALYLQKLTQELSEDLDKIRNADDFKAESVPSLVHALQQGAKQFSSAQQNAVLKTSENRQG
ncbi:ribosome-assembly protein 3 domain-containing protein [Trichoderma afarasin]